MDEVILSNWDYLRAKYLQAMKKIQALEELAESQRDLVDELQESLRRERERKHADSL